MLMIDVVQKTYEFIQELFDVESGGELLLRLAARDPVPQWEDPKQGGQWRRGCCHSATVSALGVLPLFAVSAIPCPGDGFQARFANRLPAFFTDPKSTLAKPR
jgi:hypothetical protein